MAIMQVTRRIVAVADGPHGIIVVADDGTAWLKDYGGWCQIEPLPPREVEFDDGFIPFSDRPTGDRPVGVGGSAKV